MRVAQDCGDWWSCNSAGAAVSTVCQRASETWTKIFFKHKVYNSQMSPLPFRCRWVEASFFWRFLIFLVYQLWESLASLHILNTDWGWKSCICPYTDSSVATHSWAFATSTGAQFAPENAPWKINHPPMFWPPEEGTGQSWLLPDSQHWRVHRHEMTWATDRILAFLLELPFGNHTWQWKIPHLVRWFSHLNVHK